MGISRMKMGSAHRLKQTGPDGLVNFLFITSFNPLEKNHDRNPNRQTSRKL